jgi:GrpB-like predicted nucleotidyltransferase (UPF0157 family)
MRRIVRAAISDQVLRIRHAGSTAVPGLIAKPILDIDLTVPVVEDEHAYVPRLEAVGFCLIFRDDIAGNAHRQLAFALPNTNLHVWSPGAVEPQRHELFIQWLRTHDGDRGLYAAAKRAAAASGDMSRYNELKSAVIYDIYERVFLADPQHRHDPQPRESSR